MKNKLRYKIKDVKNPYTSSWSFKEKFLIRVWRIIYILLFRTSPKIMGRYWRVCLLRLFGCKIHWKAFVYSSSKIYAPWLLKIGKRSCIGPNCEVYNLGPVEIDDFSTISQNVYICNGSHDFSLKSLPLIVGDIYIGKNFFVGANAFILPGIKIHDYAIIGAASVVTKNVGKYEIVGGNPAKFIKKRVLK